jgi:hypothetical protein
MKPCCWSPHQQRHKKDVHIVVYDCLKIEMIYLFLLRIIHFFLL